MGSCCFRLPKSNSDQRKQAESQARSLRCDARLKAATALQVSGCSWPHVAAHNNVCAGFLDAVEDV